jgi:hypothetical protein
MHPSSVEGVERTKAAKLNPIENLSIEYALSMRYAGLALAI